MYREALEESRIFEDIFDLDLQQGSGSLALKKLEKRYFLEEDELSLAAGALLASHLKVPFKKLSIEQLESGAVPLYERGFFPWGKLPYPKEHAQLGRILAHTKGFENVSLKMANFQQATLDHQKNPLRAFLSQDTGSCFDPLIKANESFFESLNIEPLQNYQYLDEELGIFHRRDEEKTLHLTASGCKSGMGAYLYKDLGIINFGFQVLRGDSNEDNGKGAFGEKPRGLGDCGGFGLSSRPRDFAMQVTEDSASFSFKGRQAFFHNRFSSIYNLYDSGFSGVWLDAKLSYSKKILVGKFHILGERAASDLAFCVFCKSPACYVAKSHKLSPKSLDRYQGPAEVIELRSGSDALQVCPGFFSGMEIIPLAGDNSYWGADFLIAYFLKESQAEIRFVLK